MSWKQTSWIFEFPSVGEVPSVTTFNLKNYGCDSFWDKNIKNNFSGETNIENFFCYTFSPVYLSANIFFFLNLLYKYHVCLWTYPQRKPNAYDPCAISFVHMTERMRSIACIRLLSTSVHGFLPNTALIRSHAFA